MTFLEELHNRRKKLADVLEDDEYSGIRNIVEELYPDRAHFIYELLQNAEDKKADVVNFNLKEDALIFEHDGTPFDDSDVEAITNIGKGTKRDQEDKIGRFGIGFKSVFAYTETPLIWSPTYSFKIEKLVLPSAIPPYAHLGHKTRFEFPFNSRKKTRKAAYDEVARGLEELAETTLLFLRNIKLLGWQIGNGNPENVRKISPSENHVVVLKQKGKERVSGSHFLLFSKPCEIDGRPTQNVSVAFELDFLPKVSQFNAHKPLSEQLKIVPAKPGKVAVFFPAEKETSGLRFHLNGPFVPELSRASIKETPANEPLFRQLAELTASSLHQIRDIGLLTGDFLGVLPNSRDELPERYVVIRDTITDRMNKEPLTPTASKSHAPAKNLLQAKAALKDLLTEQDLKYIIDDKTRSNWAIAASQRNSLQDHFLSGLAIENWDIQQFVELLSRKTVRLIPDEQFIHWLSGKSGKWHQQMYALLYRDLNSLAHDYEKDLRMYALKSLKIVRLSDGNYSTPDKCYFPGVGVEHDDVLPRVDRTVYQTKAREGQKSEAAKFLELIGVREVGEDEEIERILKVKYRDENTPSDLRDLKRFIGFVEKHPDKTRLFSSYCIFKKVDGSWGSPSELFLDSPFLETGLGVFYGALEEMGTPLALSRDYLNCRIAKEKIVQFAISVGIIHKLPIHLVMCFYNPQWAHLSCDSGSSTNGIDEDYIIDNLDVALQNPSVKLSQLVWKTMNSIDSKFLQAKYQKSRKWPVRTADSQLVHLLRNAAWIPQKKGGFVKPSDASANQLLKGFPYDEGQEWLTRVEFGKAGKQHGEEYQAHSQIVQKIGFESLDDAIQAASFLKVLKEQGKTLDDFQLQLRPHQIDEKPDFPIRSVGDLARREEHLAQDWDEATKKKYRKKMRKVRTTKGAVDPTIWLKNQYTNEADQMICQICKEEMPFKKPDGEYYFEAVEIVPNDFLRKEHEAQFLALCPLCAAKYKVFVKNNKRAVRDLLTAFQKDSPKYEISLRLGKSKTSIRFVESHWQDLKTIMKRSQAPKQCR